MKQLKIMETIHETMGKMWIFELIDMKSKAVLYRDSILDEEEVFSYDEVNESVQNILKTKGFLV